MKANIFLFRHGTTTDNAAGVFSGWRDVSLNDKGKRDAKIVALRLKDKKIGIAFNSGMKRSIETLNEVLKFHPECTFVVEDKRIKERSYGDLQGRTHVSVVEKEGVKKYDAWRRGYEVRAKGGESLKDVEVRVLDFLKDLIELVKDKKVNVAISAHGNSMRAFRRYFEKLSVKEMTKLWNDFELVYEYTITV